MAPPGAQPDLADDATFEPRGHSRYNSTATQATLVVDVAQPGANALDGPLKGAADSDDIHVVDNQRFRVTAGTPLGPNAAATTANTGSSTAAAPRNVPSITAAALAVADPTTTTTAANEGPSGGNVAGVADGDCYEDWSDDEFDYNNAFVIDVPPGHKMIRVSTPGPDDYLDQDGNAWSGPVPCRRCGTSTRMRTGCCRAARTTTRAGTTPTWTPTGSRPPYSQRRAQGVQPRARSEGDRGSRPARAH